jgi:hypothetical protein
MGNSLLKEDMMTTKQLTFSNPRKEAMIEDWPIGRQRCRASFMVETHPTRGERVCRVTENKSRTGWNAPKRTTYGSKCVIVDGSDGRTYILDHSGDYGMITIRDGNMKHTKETVFADDTERFAELFLLVTDPDT